MTKDGWLDKCTFGGLTMDKWMTRCIDQWVDGWMVRLVKWIEDWIDGRTDGQMIRWTEEWMYS